MIRKYVYLFSEGNATMRNLLGGKGANLAEMTNLGLPVPQGFIVTTEACTKYYEDGRKISQEIIEQIDQKMVELEKINGKKFGDKNDPLLVSVRSGARVSMPGMMAVSYTHLDVYKRQRQDHEEAGRPGTGYGGQRDSRAGERRNLHPDGGWARGGNRVGRRGDLF